MLVSTRASSPCRSRPMSGARHCQCTTVFSPPHRWRNLLACSTWSLEAPCTGVRSTATEKYKLVLYYVLCERTCDNVSTIPTYPRSSALDKCCNPYSRGASRADVPYSRQTLNRIQSRSYVLSPEMYFTPCPHIYPAESSTLAGVDDGLHFDAILG